MLLECCAFSAVMPVCGASKVMAVISRSLVPYQEALKGYEQSGTFEIEKVNLEGDVAKGRLIKGDGKDVLLILGTEALTAIKDNWPDVPVVYTMVLEPYDAPGRRVSGVLMQVPLNEQIARIAKMFPDAKKIGVIYNPVYSKKAVNQAREMVGEFGMSLIPVAVEKPEEISAALANLRRAEVNVLWSVIDPTVAQPVAMSQMIKFSLDEKLPFIALANYHVKAGALATFGVDYNDIGAQTAALTRKMIETPGWHGRIETPRKIVIYVNTETRKHLGLDRLSQYPEVRPIE